MSKLNIDEVPITTFRPGKPWRTLLTMILAQYGHCSVMGPEFPGSRDKKPRYVWVNPKTGTIAVNGVEVGWERMWKGLLGMSKIHMVVFKSFEAEPLLQDLQASFAGVTSRSFKFPFGTVSAHTHSIRYDVFRQSLKCCRCGIVGSIMLLETDACVYKGTLAKNKPLYSAHWNLYAVLSTGALRLMTQDHIIPKSLGGPTTLANLRTMCARCNHARGNMFDRPGRQQHADDVEFAKRFFINPESNELRLKELQY